MSLPRWSSLCRVNYPRMTHHFSTHVFRTNNVRWINSFDTNFSSKWLINETFVRSPGEKREIVFTPISTLVMHVDMRGFRRVWGIQFGERFFEWRSNYIIECFFRTVTKRHFFQKIQIYFLKIIFFRLLKMYTRAILSNPRRVAAQQSVRNAVSFQLFIYGISALHFLKIQFILGNSNRRGML